jgi:hypothetical protein
MRVAIVLVALALLLLAAGPALALKCRGSKEAVEHCLLVARWHTYGLTRCVSIAPGIERCVKRRPAVRGR